MASPFPTPLESRRQCRNAFILRENNKQPTIIFSTKLSLKHEGRRETFLDITWYSVIVMVPSESQLPFTIPLCDVTLLFLPVTGVCFFTSWVWSCGVTCFNQQNMAEVILCEFHSQGFKEDFTYPLSSSGSEITVELTPCWEGGAHLLRMRPHEKISKSEASRQSSLMWNS